MRREARLAEQFAAAIEGRATAVGARRDPALAPLLGLAQGLRTLPAGPEPAFRDALRSRLMAVAAVSAPAPVPAPWERFQEWLGTWRMQRLIGASAGAMAGVVAITGVATAAGRSLPGDPLYGVKRSAEAIQVGLARNDVNEGKRHLQHAETRMREIAAIVGTDLALAPVASAAGTDVIALGGSKAEQVISALDAMDDQTQAGTRLLTRAAEKEGSTAPLRALARFANRQQTHLHEVMVDVPDRARPDAQASLQLVDRVARQAEELLSGSPSGSPDTVTNPIDGPSVTPTPTPASTPTPEPNPTPTPGTPDDDPSSSPSSEPASESPTTEPTSSPSPEPEPTEPSESPSESPSPSPSPSGVLPSTVPGPVRSPLQDVLDEVGKRAPSPLPTRP